MGNVLEENEKRNIEYEKLSDLVGFSVIGLTLGDSFHSPTIVLSNGERTIELYKYHRFNGPNVASYYGVMPA